MRLPKVQPPKVKETERPTTGGLRPRETDKRTAKGVVHLKREKKKVAKSKTQQPAAKKSRRRSPRLKEKQQDKAVVTKPSNKEAETVDRLSTADEPIENAAKPEVESEVGPSVVVEHAQIKEQVSVDSLKARGRYALALAIATARTRYGGFGMLNITSQIQFKRITTPPPPADSDSYNRSTPVRLAERNMDANGVVDDTRDEVHSKDGPVKNAKDFRMKRWAEQTTKEGGDPTTV
ncbi:hypothetical protein LTR56_002920 [Elasticomyces elasticus]|nr:hypothetical protein LTR56_002920 [Elasticomyces elasticus]KAK3665121.1 hypothetical protein LTR22_003927 [Elasticomyces elasticus]KAK4930706.1 hypothetical protein LTR49_002794 [Elasticomyces elasticus]KAK5759929.1 hypothetical protein LTS12_009977 [Elasticomyces elasticus]